MMNLKSMKMKAEKYEPEAVGSSPGKGDQYPWGLRLNLGNEEIEKLGLDFSGLSAGDTVAIIAKATICDLSEREELEAGEGKEVYRNCSIQIKELEIKTDETKREKTGTIKEILARASESIG